MTFSFSASRKAFFPADLRDDYEAAGSWPDDAVEVSEQVWRAFVAQPPEGKAIGAGDDGQPAWVDIPPQPEPTLDEIKTRLSAAVQRHLDAAAIAMGYDSIFTAVTYADEPAVAKFQTEGQQLRVWRSRVWAACYDVMDDVVAGNRTAPTADELLAELPAL